MHILKRSVSFDFATSDENFAYIYNTTRDTSSLSGDDIYSLLMSDVAQLIGTDGYTIGAHSTVGYMNDSDYPYGNNARYYPFTITLSSITYSNTDSLSLPSTDENGIYYRRSNGVALAFNTDYDQMISYIQNRLISRRNQITYYFATSDPEYIYNESNSAEIREQFIRDVMTDVYKKDSALPSNAGGGDYLFKSIKKVVIGSIPYTPAEDNPTEGNTRYSVFYFSLRNICYYTNFEQEEFIRRYCSDFSEKFIREDASDYDKVKTIYDFVVRNTKYDWDVFTDREKYPVNSERYTVAHSAYGALRGNLDEEESFSWSNKQSITGENIISTADQGLAVCEGYSKLFYYLCVMNGIPCRIVDGDYVDESGKGSDPHEWNYVWLDDGCGDGYKWFEVDTTFAAQNSFKDVDMNNYDYFLCGRENINFGYMNHQQPYHIDNTSIDAAFVIYDYWGDNGDSTYVSSKEDYQFRKLNFNNIDALQGGYIVRRSTEYEGDTDVKVALIHSTKDDQYIINIDDNGDVLPTDIHGFIYNGQPQSVYEVFIPYLDIKEYEIDKLTGIKDAGQYTINIKGANNTFVQISFNIIPMDLDNSHEGNYDYDTLNIQKSAVYTGNTIQSVKNLQSSQGIDPHLGIAHSIDFHAHAILEIDDVQSLVGNNDAVSRAEAALHEPLILNPLLDHEDGVFCFLLCLFVQFHHIVPVPLAAILHFSVIVAEVGTGIIHLDPHFLFKEKLAKLMRLRAFFSKASHLVRHIGAELRRWGAVYPAGRGRRAFLTVCCQSFLHPP